MRASGRQPHRRLPPALWAALVALSTAIGGCGPKVERVDPSEVLDYQAGFDEDDAREVATALVDDVVTSPWLQRWRDEHAGAKPTVIVGDLMNNTSDYLEPRLMTKSLERALLNTGQVNIVASADERGQLRDERFQGQEWNRPETVKRMAYELGADLMLIGWIGEDVEVSRNRSRRIQYYQVALELVDIESNQKAWIGAHDIEKRVIE